MIYDFSEEDRRYPVYCTKCRAHLPRAISDKNKGLCASCVPPVQPVATQYAPQQQQSPSCPVCKQVLAYQPGRVDSSIRLAVNVAMLLCFVAGLCLWFLLPIGVILLIAGFFVPIKRERGMYFCQGCGYSAIAPH